MCPQDQTPVRKTGHLQAMTCQGSTVWGKYMPRKQKYQGVSRLPTSGHYQAEISVLFARGPDSEYLISDKAFRMWSLIKACGTDGSGCDLNDEELGLALSIYRQQAVKVRQELVKVDLVHESKAYGRRVLYALAPGEQAPDSSAANSSTEISNPLVQDIYRILRQYQVYSDNARQIAVMMVEAGLDLAQARRAFLAQMADTRDISQAVWRLQQGQFVPPHEMLQKILAEAQELGIDVSQTQSQYEALSEEDQRLVDLMVDRCNSPEKAAVEAVCGAKDNWGEGWSPVAFELEVLRWLAYCLHPKFGRTVTPASYIPARLKQGIAAASWFTDYRDLRTEIAQLQQALDPPTEKEELDDSTSTEDECHEPEPSDPEPIPTPGTPLWCTQVWQETLSQLKMQMAEAPFETWIRPATLLSFEDDVFTIGVHNAQAKDWVENQLAKRVTQALSSTVEHPVQAQFVVRSKNGHNQ